MSMNSRVRASPQNLLAPMPPDGIAIIFVGLIVAGALFWNLFAKLPFQDPAWVPVLTAAPMLAVSIYCIGNCPQRKILSQIPLYIGLWMLFSFFSSRLAYLGISR